VSRRRRFARSHRRHDRRCHQGQADRSKGILLQIKTSWPFLRQSPREATVEVRPSPVNARCSRLGRGYQYARVPFCSSPRAGPRVNLGACFSPRSVVIGDTTRNESMLAMRPRIEVNDDAMRWCGTKNSDAWLADGPASDQKTGRVASRSGTKKLAHDATYVQPDDQRGDRLG
jgi:hypothetical protein